LIKEDDPSVMNKLDSLPNDIMMLLTKFLVSQFVIFKITF
jgi:hypothetical protein